MNKLSISSFKAFDNELKLTIDNSKNVLLYGENGAGKSSLFEALKVIFFRDRLEAESSASALTPEDKQQLLNELWSSYNNKIINNNFGIEINDVDFRNFDASPYQSFLISIEGLFATNNINLKVLLDSFYVAITDTGVFCEAYFKEIETEVNNSLTEFKESVRIKIDEEDNYSIIITDDRKGIDRKSELKKYFNEAKLNLIVLLILFNSVIKAMQDDKKKIIVLDDFITSLDSSNRTFLVKYILRKFNNVQILIFTHNISFFNLTAYIIHEATNVNNARWEFATLYEIENRHKMYTKSAVETVSDIKTFFNQLPASGTAESIENVGNRIRKRFEILLCECSKLLTIGAVEDTRHILERLTNSKAIYFKIQNKKVKSASDLVEEIEVILSSNPQPHHQQLTAAIQSYKNVDLTNLRRIVNELKLYQKVTMHPMSHSSTGMPNFTIKEIQESFALLEKMEKLFDDTKKDVVNV